jgi:hypothetical protein
MKGRKREEEKGRLRLRDLGKNSITHNGNEEQEFHEQKGIYRDIRLSNECC